MEEEFHPVIHPSDWEEAKNCARRRFFLGDGASPLIVTYATNPRDPSTYLTQDEIRASDQAPRDIERKAVRRWAEYNNPFRWRTQSFPGGLEDALTIPKGNYTASSFILSKGHLQGIHEHFQEQNLGIIIPGRGLIVVHPDFLAMAELGRQLYQEAQDREEEFSPLCFASYEGQVLGYVTPEYEKEYGAEEAIPYKELIETATDVINVAMVMVNIRGEEDLPHLIPFTKGPSSIVVKACQNIAEEKLARTLQLRDEEHGQIQLLAKLSQAIHKFDKGTLKKESTALRQLTAELATRVSAATGGGIFRMDSITGKHEKSSLDTILEALES